MTMRRMVQILAVAACLAAAACVAVSAAPTEVLAQDTGVITMEFVGFGINPDFYAIVQGSKLSGKSLVIYQIGGQAPILVYPLKGKSVAKILKSKEVAPYNIQTSPESYVSGFTAPAGYKLGGMVIGETLQLTLSAGEKSQNLGYAPIFSNPTKSKFAEVRIKNAYWSPDSKRVIIILNQKLDGDWPVNTDLIAAYNLG